MSGNKIKLKKNISKNLIQDLNNQNKLELFSPLTRPKISIKKIILDCLSLEGNKKKNDINFSQNKSTPKHKSFSLNKYSIIKNPSNIKFGNRNHNSHTKIIINCLDGKQKNKIHKNINANYTTQKSGDASPVEFQIEKENKIYGINSRNTQQYWKSHKINCITLKKKNEPITRNINKEKEELTNFKDNRDTLSPIFPTKLNCFLNNNKGNNTAGKKELFHNSVYEKKIEPLKLFDYDVSSSSSSIDKDKESEENAIHIDGTNKENNKEEKSEKDIVNDYRIKISGELSNELNGNKEDENKKKILQKITNLSLNKNKDNKNLQKPRKSFQINTNKYSLTQSRKEIPVISSIVTKAGICDDKEKINQDSYLIIENLFFQNINIYGIYDGHGDNGHLISKFISDFMNDYYKNKFNYYLNEDDKNNVLKEKITDTFLKDYNKIIKKNTLLLDQEINTKIKYDISQSGSTSVMVFLIDDILICSNVGDSQCFLFNCSSEDLWTYESLSKQHLPSDENEKKRIIENGGEIHPYYGEDGIFEGPDRIYAKKKIYPGLIMSRTIGDLEAKKIGVISEPDIILKKIDNNSKYLVIGSDGLWDVIKPYDIIRMTRPFFNKGDIEGITQTLMKKAVNQWTKNQEERDDITIIVVFIGIPNNFLINNKNNFLNKIEETEDDKEFSSKKLIGYNDNDD